MNIANGHQKLQTNTDMKIEIKNVKYYEQMSEETTCFMADIFVNGKKVGYCKNDGHGGDTDVRGYAEHRELFKSAELYCESLPPAFVDENVTIKNSLSNVTDYLFDEWMKAKDKKKMEKDFEKGICHTSMNNELSYEMVRWMIGYKVVPLKDLLKNENCLELIKKFCQKLKEDGRIILNTNLPFEV